VLSKGKIEPLKTERIRAKTRRFDNHRKARSPLQQQRTFLDVPRNDGRNTILVAGKIEDRTIFRPSVI